MSKQKTVATCRGCDSEATRMVEVDTTPEAGRAFVAPACDDHAEDAPVVEVLDAGGDDADSDAGEDEGVQGMIASWGRKGRKQQATLATFQSKDRTGDGDALEHSPDVDPFDAILGGVHHLVEVTPGSVVLTPVDPASCGHCGPKIGYNSAKACHNHVRRSMESRRLEPVGGDDER